MSGILFLEGAGSSKMDQIGCREGFRMLLKNSSLEHRMPRLVACGPRKKAFEDFSTELLTTKHHFVAMLIDSEDTPEDLDKTWEHLRKRDNWVKPANATDDQVLFMTTCMETWIAADRATLLTYFHGSFQESALPPLNDLENRHRHTVLKTLEHATRNCTNPYAKGKRSFELLGKLNPVKLQELPSFARAIRILKEKL